MNQSQKDHIIKRANNILIPYKVGKILKHEAAFWDCYDAAAGKGQERIKTAYEILNIIL